MSRLTSSLVFQFVLIYLWSTANGYALQRHEIHVKPEARVIGGRPVHPQIIPYYVSLKLKDTDTENGFGCGGSLITDSHILTAAHCLYGKYKIIELLQFGAHRKEYEENESYDFETADASFFIHPEYRPNNRANDIAIITLSTPIDTTLPHVRIISLPSEKDPRINYYNGKTVQLFGLGEITDGEEAKELMGVDLTVIDFNTCSYNYHFLHENEICTSGLDYHSRTPVGGCFGDSGGPLVYSGTLIGVTSRLAGRGSSCMIHDPTVFVRTDRYLDWIQEQIYPKSAQ